ncbi:MAG: hypothetical protein EBR30_14435 [Cytophagia bacterium]|nr:hypothetical protein [Cytophagia bacterium]
MSLEEDIKQDKFQSEQHKAAINIVEKLRQKNLVQREICEDNRRQVDISITDKGLTLLKKLDAEAGLMKGIMDKLSKTEAKELNRMLDKLREDN